MTYYPQAVLKWEICEGVGRSSQGLFRPKVVPFEAHLNEPGRLPNWNSLQELIRDLEHELERLKALPEMDVPDEALANLPAIGDKVWAIKEWSDEHWEALEVKVTEYAIMEGRLSVVFGFYYKPYDEIFSTKEAAEAFKKEPPS